MVSFAWITKGRIARILILGFVLLFLFPVSVLAAEEVQDFQSNITIQENSSVIVTEKIRYNFENDRHGIFRYIPLVNEFQGKEKDIDIDVLEVLRNSSPEPYTVSEERGNIRIKVGDPDETITGSHDYSIKYKVRWPINYLGDYDEFYWNVTGNEWDVPIRNVQARVNIPKSFEPNSLRVSCYEGVLGSTNECEERMIPSGTSTQLVFKSDQELSPGEGMTVAVRMPKGFLEMPSDLEKLMLWLSDNWPFGIPLVVFIFMIRRWYRLGRDPKERAVYARYEPPKDMKPTLVGAVVDEKVNNRDLTAGLIYLAEQGFIRVKRVEEDGFLFFDGVDYELTLEKDLESIKGVEKDILKMFFDKDDVQVGESIKLSDLEDSMTFVDKSRDIKHKVHKEMADRGLFSKSPKKVRGLYMGIAFVVFFGSYYVMAYGVISFTFFLSMAISALIIFGFSFFMSRKTRKGAEVMAHILGFKEFLSKTQKERLEFHNAPEKSPEEFMEFLPYAIALEVEEEWGKQFEDVYIEPPSWYEGHHGGTIAAPAFARGLNDFSKSTSKTVSTASESSASGGGFSGGGFGGGGGGSW